MKKLIMVGMRFQNPAEVAAVKLSVKSTKKVRVSLKTESNENGINGISVAVYSTNEGYKVGYIRNVDLKELLNSYPGLSTEGAVLYGSYYVDRTYDNYWLLLNQPSEEGYIPVSNSTYTDEISAFKDYVDYSKADVGYSKIKVPLSKEYHCKFINNPMKDDKMKLATSMRDSFFREVTNVAIDIQSGKFGVISTDGIAVYSNGGVSVNPITDLGVKVPAYAFRVAVSDLKEGDIIINGNDTSFFKAKAKDADTYEVVSLNGEVKTVGNVTNMFFGKNTVLAVRNMFGDSMNPLMLAMIAGDGKMDNKNMMLAMAMGGMGGNSGGFGEMNPLMMMMLLKD